LTHGSRVSATSRGRGRAAAKTRTHELIFLGLADPEGLGAVSGAPNLPAGLTDRFSSRYVDIGELRLHAVIGGEGRRCCSCTAYREGSAAAHGGTELASR
jgi:hypothetical protein